MENETDHSADGNKYWRICHFHTDEIRMITGFPSNVYYTKEIALIFNILLTILTIFLNSVTILAFMRSTQLKSKKSYFLIMLLSVNDLLVGLFGNSSYVSLLIAIKLGYPECKIYIAFEVVSICLSSMSIMTLFALNIERYLSILHPFYHRTKVTRSRLLKMVVAFWLLPLTLRSLQFIFGKIMKIIISATIVCVVFSTVYIYASIYIAMQRRPCLAEPRETEGQVTVTQIVEGRTNKKKELQNFKMTKSCAIVVGLVFVCNLPFAVTNSLPTRITPTLAVMWTVTFSLSASSLNSLVFFWKNAILRKETKKLFQNFNN